MPTNIVVPELGESIVEATVANWLKQEGDRVSVGEVVVELETDKVDLEVGAPQDGILARIEAQTGQDVQVGETLGVVEDLPEGEKRPSEGPTGEGKEVEDISPQAQAEGPENGQAPEPQEVSGEALAAEPSRAAERVTPVARRLAEEQGIDLGEITAAAGGKRVTRQDVERFIQQREGDGRQRAAPPDEAATPRVRAAEPTRAAEPPTPGAIERREGDRHEERVRMSRRRRTIAERLVEAQRTAAMLTTFNDVDMTAVMALRQRRRESFQEKHGVKLGIMSFFVKATIGALKEFPRLNAEVQGDEIVLKHYYDIGIAVGAEEGLVVPVLRDADEMTFAEIEKTINALIEKVRYGTLSIEDLRGGTFSITNGGVFGSLLSTPILNPPQVGILGIHRIEDRPVAQDGQVAIRPMMYLALSYDHRIVDGREAVLFLRRLKELVEDPEALLLEG